MKNPGIALATGAENGNAVLSKNPNAALPTIPEFTKYYHFENGWCPPKSVRLRIKVELFGYLNVY